MRQTPSSDASTTRRSRGRENGASGGTWATAVAASAVTESSRRDGWIMMVAVDNRSVRQVRAAQANRLGSGWWSAARSLLFEAV